MADISAPHAAAGPGGGALARFLDLVSLCRAIAFTVEAGRDPRPLLRRLGLEQTD